LNGVPAVTVVPRGRRPLQEPTPLGRNTKQRHFDLSPRSVGGANPNALIRIP